MSLFALYALFYLSSGLLSINFLTEKNSSMTIMSTARNSSAVCKTKVPIQSHWAEVEVSTQVILRDLPGGCSCLPALSHCICCTRLSSASASVIVSTAWPPTNTLPNGGLCCLGCIWMVSWKFMGYIVHGAEVGSDKHSFHSLWIS